MPRVGGNIETETKFNSDGTTEKAGIDSYGETVRRLDF